MMVKDLDFGSATLGNKEPFGTKVPKLLWWGVKSFEIRLTNISYSFIYKQESSLAGALDFVSFTYPKGGMWHQMQRRVAWIAK